MLTVVKTPHDVFFLPQRLLVPLFQRPYVWSREGQWAPLWSDVERLASALYSNQPPSPHFLGAVVLQQQANELGTLSVRSVIDGQQRLTTLQLLLDAVHERVLVAGFEDIAKQVQDLVENPKHFCLLPEDRYKVWPTNRDRPAFNEVMSAPVPVGHDELDYSASRMVQAHKYFSGEIASWLGDDEDQGRRAHALVQAVTHWLQVVVIDLLVDEDAQEIFETLNARGTPLTAADLIKNFVFQRLQAGGGDSESAYAKYWEEFETPFWEKEVSAGRLLYSRSSLFLSQWLVAKSLKDVPAREVFGQFKRHVVDSTEDVESLLPQIRAAADIYRKFTVQAQSSTAIFDRLTTFIYRTGSLDSEVVKPIVIWLRDPELAPIPSAQFDKALACLESWMVRRAFVRANTQSYNRLLLELLIELARSDRVIAGDVVENYLARQSAPTSYWPGDDEVRRTLATLPIYRRFQRGRLRMVLEAIEDQRRGWNSAKPFHEQPAPRGNCTIEHVMPQEWATNWGTGKETEVERGRRDLAIQTLGNLTLLTQALNSKVSNGPWSGAGGKYQTLDRFTSLLLTKEVRDMGADGWNEALIDDRTERMIDDVLTIWPVPTGHTGKTLGAIQTASTKLTVADLVNAGLIAVGQVLHARPKAAAGKTCEVSEDGGLYIGTQRYETLSSAAKATTHAQSEAGWWFWLIDPDGDRSMFDVRRDYLEELNADDSSDAIEEF